ncbi:MAG TPA: O-antigen ligase family protein [Pyrinomonadaceae bacterium]|nr:O-antigen ligase family protein [Pyrinomonadaceae bacterium]
MDSSAISTTERSPTTTDERGGRAISAWLDRVIVGSLFALAFFAPHSIALTQMAWACGLLLWAIRFAVRPRPALHRTPVDYALLGFFILTLISALASYDPETSIGKLRAASLFTIVYLVAENVPSRRVVRLLVLTLVASCMINVIYTLGERAVGRGVKVQGVLTTSPLFAAGIRDGDTLLEVDGHALSDPQELVNALAASDLQGAGPARVKIFRFEATPTFEVPRGQLLEGATPLARLGISSWSRGRDWRASGLYGLYVTYAEALQLIASLAFGLFIALRRKRTLSGVLLLLALAGLCTALLLTVTRASGLAFLLSALVIVLVGASRRTALIVMACALPFVIAGLFILQQKRNVGFYDQKDLSITWRETVWREGFHLLMSRPRHMLVGVGMDSIKRHWREWGLFDRGQLPIGHMHSNFLALALERGLPALIVWLILMGIYGHMLWRLARSQDAGGWIERGLVLGALGGLVGFLTSGVVHYNWGDSEVVMIFYLIMGLSLVVEREAKRNREHAVNVLSRVG